MRILLLSILFSLALSADAAKEVVIAENGHAKLPVYLVGVDPPAEKAPKSPPSWLTATSRVHDAVPDLVRCLQQMSGATFPVSTVDAPADGPALLIGSPDRLGLVGETLRGEEFLIRSHGGRIYLAASTELGLSHAIYALLDRLGCRWYFPGDLWEIVPRSPRLALAIDERQGPDFPDVRLCVFVYATKSPALRRATADWNRRNRMTNHLDASTSHVWCGLDPKRDFAEHPEWFALTSGPDGKQSRQPLKPCYSHPETIARGIAYARQFFLTNPQAAMVSVTPPDDMGYCECDRCLARAGVTETARRLDTTFGRNSQGEWVSVTSETVYHFTNEVARAVAREFPGKWVGVGAYSAYSHPPSFAFEPNVYASVTSGFRRTPMTPDRQIAAFGKKTEKLAIYEYYDVINWDYDLPGRPRAAQFDYLAGSTRFYHHQGVTGLKGEASNNWGVCGIGYYALSRLMWDTSTDVRALEREFYQSAFGPAAGAIERFYRRWSLRPDVTDASLALAYRDLQEAVAAVGTQEPYRERVDRIRMYAHFLKTQLIKARPRPEEVARWKESFGEDGARERLRDFGTLLSRLMDTGMVQSYAFNEFLEAAGKELGVETAAYRAPGVIPNAAEVDRWFAEDLRSLPEPAKEEPDLRLFSKDLVPLAGDDERKKALNALQSGHFSTATAQIWAEQGEAVRLRFRLGEFPAGMSDEVLCVQSFSPAAFQAGMGMAARKAEKTRLRPEVEFVAAETGYFQVDWVNAALLSSSHPLVFKGGEFRWDSGDLYFFVPEGTRHFAIRLAGAGRTTAVVTDPAGRERLAVRDDPRAEFLLAVAPESAGGIWKVSGPAHPQGGAGFTLFGIPNYFSPHPALLMVPREAAPQPTPP
jgi:hypothetical protein